MSHQPFETWIFSDQPLQAAETQALQDHLAVCEACRQLAEAWGGVVGELTAAPLAAPAPGFVARWEARLGRERERFQRRLNWAALAISLGGAAFFAGLIFLQALSSFRSPTRFFVYNVYQLTALTSLAKAGQEMLLTVVRVLPVEWW